MDRFPYIRTLIKTRLEMNSKLMNVIDIGAYDGSFAADLAKTFPNLTVHAIEPCRYCWPLIEKEMRSLPNMKLHKLAIAERNGKVKLFEDNFSSRPAISSTIIPQVKEGLSKESTVDCMTLDTFCEKNNIKNIDLICINAEGAEYLMFEHFASLDYIMKSKIVDVSMHGKSLHFLTEYYAKLRHKISETFEQKGYNILFGDRIKSDNNIAVNHIRQVWAK